MDHKDYIIDFLGVYSTHKKNNIHGPIRDETILVKI